MVKLDLGLEGKTVLITGAGRGLGAACAEGFHTQGAKVIAVARSEADLIKLRESHPGMTIWVDDVTQASFFAKVRALDELDVLVNNAGFNDPKPMLETQASTLDTMLNLNVRSVYLTSQAALKVMQKTGGAIVNMSSQMGHVGSPNRTVYCMTKHAIEGLTKAMAVEVANLGVRVNSVAPTFVETDLTRPMLSDPAFSEFVKNNIPLGKLGQMEDVVHAVLFLSSKASAMTTGHSLLVDGGWTAH